MLVPLILIYVVLRFLAQDYTNKITNTYLYKKPAYTYVLKYSHEYTADCMYLKIQDKIKEEKWQISLEDVLLVIYSESQFNPKAVNMQKGDNKDPRIRCKTRATGIIQFMPNVAKELGTTNSDIYNTDICSQIELAFKYLEPYKEKVKDAISLKIAILYPAALNNNTIVISKSNDPQAYLSNSALDTNDDNIISKEEVKSHVYKNQKKLFFD